MKNPKLLLKPRIFFLVTLLCAAMASLQSSHANTITVDSADDSGPGSLRQALADANDGDTINFNLPYFVTINLTSGQLVVDKSVIISGPGADVLAVSGNAASRVFLVNSGLTVTISGLTITGGAGGSFGGGIYNAHATLTISNARITRNLATFGGGIFNDGDFVGSATLTINNSTIDNNSATYGGGIMSDGGSGGTAHLTVNSSIVSNNSGTWGGGIFNYGEYNSGSATLTINNSTISGNSAYDGAGIRNSGQHSGNATLTATNSTVSGNSATHFGGGGENNGSDNGSATLDIANSTLAGNSASNTGGGIFNTTDYGNVVNNSGSATVTIVNSTLSANSTSGNGGGISNFASSGSAILIVNNTTLSGDSATIGGGIYNVRGAGGTATLQIGGTILNTGASGANISNIVGTVTSLGYNLSSDDASAFLNATGDQNNTDPVLGPLQDNGGPTFTHALLTGSPAINAGDPNFTPPPNYDQRGAPFARVANGRIDIGSFEVQNCPESQGYWKNNPTAWPVNSLTLGSQTYTKTQLLTILGLPVGTGPKADASLILADQLIAAKLNIANGADGTPVTSTISDADTVLSLYPGVLPYSVRTNSTNGQRMVNDAATLESFNKGFLTPGCGG